MKRKRRAAAPLRRGPAVLLGDGCLLLLVLAGTVFSFLTAFSVQIHALPLLLGCAAAALAFLGLWSLPRRWWALPLALLAAAWLLAVRRLWQPLALGADALRVDVVNTVSASLELGFTLEPALSLPEALWTNCATLLVLLALVPLGALLGLGVVRLRSFWLVFVSSFPFVLLPLCISVTPGWLPLMALVLGWVVPALTSLLARTSPLGAARLNLAALPAAALLLAALSLAMPMDTWGTACWRGAAPSALAAAGDGWPTPTAPSLSPTRGRCASPDAPCWRWRPTSLAASTCGGSPTRYMTARAGSRWMRRPTTGRPASAASHMERPSRWTWTLASLGLSPCSPSSSP